MWENRCFLRINDRFWWPSFLTSSGSYQPISSLKDIIASKPWAGDLGLPYLKKEGSSKCGKEKGKYRAQCMAVPDEAKEKK